jgi:hypothetical protein
VGLTESNRPPAPKSDDEHQAESRRDEALTLLEEARKLAEEASLRVDPKKRGTL